MSTGTIAFRQVDWGDLVQHLAKCSTAMQQWSAHCLFTGWISHSCTATDCWAISTTDSENNQTANISPSPLFILLQQVHTTPCYMHSLKSTDINKCQLTGITCTHSKMFFFSLLITSWLCRFLSSQTQSNADRLFYTLCKRIQLYCDTAGLQIGYISNMTLQVLQKWVCNSIHSHIIT